MSIIAASGAAVKKICDGARDLCRNPELSACIPDKLTLVWGTRATTDMVILFTLHRSEQRQGGVTGARLAGLELTGLPFKSTQDVEYRLNQDATPLTDQEIQDLYPWMQQLGTGAIRRLEAELSLRNIQAVRQFDKSSGRIGKWSLWLNVALFILTIVAVWIAIRSYREAKRSSAEQQATLESSRHSLEVATTSLDRLARTADEQLRQIQEYQKQALAKPSFTAKLQSLQTNSPTTFEKVGVKVLPHIAVPYGADLVLVLTVQNKGSAAHSVRLVVGVTPIPIERFEPAGGLKPASGRTFGGESLNEYLYEFPSFYAHDIAVYPIMLRVKANAPDRSAQMYVRIDSPDLSQRYEQWWIFRKN